MARSGQVSSEGREQIWRERVQQQQASGQSVREFCVGAGLSLPSFYWWRRELRKRDARRGAEYRPRFVPVRVTDAASVLEVVLGGGCVVRVGGRFDAAHLRAVVAALEATPC
jgi:hypothetical protein